MERESMQLRAQGATEYLVLLAVVLTVALVSVALLGFFPGMASDAQITQSQAYWQSATPISILESAAKYSTDSGYIRPYMRIRNSGAYPIRLTAIIGADGGSTTQIYIRTECGLVPVAGNYNISDYYYMAPGEEKYFSRGAAMFGTGCAQHFYPRTDSSTGAYVGGASSVCQNSSDSPGTLDFKTFGFEYIEYIDGQQITKRQIGKDWMVKCQPAAPG